MDETPGPPALRREEHPVHIRTFLIADIRGYTAFTRERGDEAAAELASTFARIVREGVEAHGGTVVELRGDEALAAFSSTRQALRGAVDLQIRFGRHSGENERVALPVGIGIDAGEAVPVEGGYRGSALNMAARLCSAARPGEILTTQAVAHLAGTVESLEYSERRLRNVKGMEGPIQAVAVSSPEMREALPAVPETTPRRTVASEGELEARITSMVDRYVSNVQEQVNQHLSTLEEMPQFQPPPRRARPARELPSRELPIPAVPSGPDRRPRQRRGQPPSNRTPLLVTLLGLILLALIVIGVLLWLHAH